MNSGKINRENNQVSFSAEIWDQMQFFFKEYNDHQMHGVIYFEDVLNRDLIKQAFILSMDIVPILGSRFVINKFNPYWEKIYDFKDTDVISFMNCSDPGGEVQQFITDVTNELAGPQLKVRVIRSSNRDTLCIVMNHMVCDGAGFKEYLYLLGEIYTSLENGTNDFKKYINGSRNSKQIYEQFDLIEKLKILALPNEPTKNKNDIRFPLSDNKDVRHPFILTHKLSQYRFEALKRYSKSHSVTINDIILAAYYRVLYKMLNLNKDTSLTIPNMVDLRRYIPGKKASGICNLSSMIMCNIGCDIGNNFDETVKKVHDAMYNKKNGYAGLHGLSTLNLLFKFLPFSEVRKLIKQYYVNPMIGITNIGIIDSSRLIFGKKVIKDAFVTGSIKYPPYFQLAFTTFSNTITFSVALYGSKIDAGLVQEFFSLLNKELQL